MWHQKANLHLCCSKMTAMVAKYKTIGSRKRITGAKLSNTSHYCMKQFQPTAIYSAKFTRFRHLCRKLFINLFCCKHINDETHSIGIYCAIQVLLWLKVSSNMHLALCHRFRISHRGQAFRRVAVYTLCVILHNASLIEALLNRSATYIYSARSFIQPTRNSISFRFNKRITWHK